MSSEYIIIKGRKYTRQDISKVKTLYPEIALFLEEWWNDSPYVVCHTSGSTGIPKEILASKDAMRASAMATCRALGLKCGNSVLLCMKTEYIAGKMIIVRAIVCGLNVIPTEPSRHPLSDVDEKIDFAAMVPLQVSGSVSDVSERKKLDNIGVLIVGGGVIDTDLEKEIESLRCDVYCTYGMTETLSHVALRRVNGEHKSLSYTPLPGVSVMTDKEERIVIDYPAIGVNGLTTNDRGKINNDGTFSVLGRIDNVICSGGIKIQTEEAESIISKVYTGTFAITSLLSEEYGEEVVMVAEREVTESEKNDIVGILPKYWSPRKYIAVAQIPLTSSGKIARKEVKDMVVSYCQRKL